MTGNWNKEKSGRLYIIVYLLSNFLPAFVMAIIPFAAPSMDEFLTNIITMFLIQAVMLTAVILYTRTSSVNVLRDARLSHKPSLLQILILVGIGIALIYAGNTISTVFVAALVKAGMTLSTVNVDYSSALNVILCFVVIAVTPAFCEELFIRQGFLSGLSNNMRGITAAVLTGAIFMLMHANPAQTVHQFFLGVVLAIAVLLTGSLWAGIIVHFTNNAYVLLVTLILPDTADTDYTLIDTSASAWLWGLLILLGGLALVLLLLVLYSAVTVATEKKRGTLRADFTPPENRLGVKGIFCVGWAYLTYVMAHPTCLRAQPTALSEEAAPIPETDGVFDEKSNQTEGGAEIAIGLGSAGSVNNTAAALGTNLIVDEGDAVRQSTSPNAAEGEKIERKRLFGEDGRMGFALPLAYLLGILMWFATLGLLFIDL